MPDLKDMDSDPRLSLKKPDRFVWPPSGKPVEVFGPECDEPVTVRKIPKWMRALEQIEDSWIGVRSRSFTRRAELRGWVPSDISRVCWRCGGSVGPHEADGDGCASCRRVRVPWGRFVCLGEYEGVLGEAIRDLKFSGWRLIGRQLGALLGERIGVELKKYEILPTEAVIVPVATSWRSRMGRGIDHTLVLAGAASGASGVPMARALRRRHGPSQTGVAVSDRAKNVRGVFGRRRGAGRLKDARVVIVVDDIRTTGATMREAVKTLRKAKRSDARGELGIEAVWACAVAVVCEPERRGNTVVESDLGG